MFRYLIPVIFVIFFLSSSGQKIDYFPKRLAKDIKKTWNLDHSGFNEILLHDSIRALNHSEGKFFTINFVETVAPDKYVYIGRVNSCRAGGCSISMDTEISFETEYFDYFILFDSSAIVEFVRVFNYQATHGHEVSTKGWLKQFAGYNGSKALEVGKDIDAVSGATVSVYGITNDIQAKTRILQLLID